MKYYLLICLSLVFFSFSASAQDIEYLLKVKILTYMSLAGHPLNDVHTVEDAYHYHYFKGRADAYADCLDLLKSIKQD